MTEAQSIFLVGIQLLAFWKGASYPWLYLVVSFPAFCWGLQTWSTNWGWGAPLLALALMNLFMGIFIWRG